MNKIVNKIGLLKPYGQVFSLRYKCLNDRKHDYSFNNFFLNQMKMRFAESG